MKESELAKPVMQWLEGRGLTPFGEVPYYNRAIDVVGISEAMVEAVELKLCLTKHLLYQAYINQVTAHRSWVAVASRPRLAAERIRDGVGLLIVTGGTVEVVIEAAQGKFCSEDRVRQLRGTCHYKEPRGEAGVPTMRGIGPAQFVYDAVEKYRQDNPAASWERVFAEVPNHYCHARSLQGAMRVVRRVRAARARRLAAAVS